MELRNGYYGDIEFSDIYPAVGAITAIVSIIAALMVLLICTSASSENDNIERYNVRATEFNARPEMEREIIASYLGDGSTDENYMMSLRDDEIVDIGSFTLKVILIALAIVLAVASVVTAVGYVEEKLKKYYLADLPLQTPYGWFLFFSMFVFWPILLVSKLHMLYVQSGRKREERQAVKSVAEQELKDELKDEADAEASFRRNLSHQAKNHYVNYRVKGYSKARDHRKAELEDQIKTAEANLRDYGERIQLTQRTIGTARAELNKLNEAIPTDEVACADAIEEWRLLSEMRGVSKIALHGDVICVLVKVRVPYKNHVYDFGDYEIRIGIDDYSCRRVRSGVKLDATNKSPDYNESSGFCFGSRRGTIREYIQHARMLEAITLMIDCLHTVNTGSEIYIPECFRRVDTIETMKRRLKKTTKT